MSKKAKRKSGQTISVDKKFHMARQRKRLVERSLRQERKISALLKQLAAAIEKNDLDLDEFGAYMSVRAEARLNVRDAREREHRQKNKDRPAAPEQEQTIEEVKQREAVTA